MGYKGGDFSYMPVVRTLIVHNHIRLLFNVDSETIFVREVLLAKILSVKQISTTKYTSNTRC